MTDTTSTSTSGDAETTEHPPIASLQDLVPSFPLAGDERIYNPDGMTGAEIIIPTSIAPACGQNRAETIGYYVKYSVHEVLGRDDADRYVVSPNRHRTGKDPISVFENRLDAGTVVTQREDFTVAPSADSDPTTETTQATLHFDGASRGNPGDAATGYVLDLPSDTTSDGRYLAEHTNNEAEYKALIDGLNAALDASVTDLTIKGDSQLVVRQVTGEYDCNAENLSPLLDTVQELLAEFDDWTIEHVPRSDNSAADETANDVLDAAQATA